MAMIAAFKLDQFIATGKSTSQSNGTHGCFRARADHAGVGPYKANGLYHNENPLSRKDDFPFPFLLSHDDECDIKHPHTYLDIGIKRFTEDDEFCGFESLDDLISWFDGTDLMLLEKEGFTIKVFQGEIVDRGQYQVVFKKVA